MVSNLGAPDVVLGSSTGNLLEGTTYGVDLLRESIDHASGAAGSNTNVGDAAGRETRVIFGEEAPVVSGGPQSLSQSSGAVTAADASATGIGASSARGAVVIRRAVAKKAGTATISQQWEGRVESFDSEYVIAHLRDMSGDAGVELAQIPLELVSPFDRELLAQGALFYMTIGIRKSPAGQLFNTTWLKFARIPTGAMVVEAASEKNVSVWRGLLGLG